jgi:hypothetical protein
MPTCCAGWGCRSPSDPGLVRRYTGLATTEREFPPISFIHLRLLRKDPFGPQRGKDSGKPSRQYRKLFRRVWCRIHNGAVNEYRRGIPPSTLRIDCNDIP